jgi:hypothetical protein
MSGFIVITYLTIGAIVSLLSFFFMGPRGLKLADQPIDRLRALAFFEREFRKDTRSRLRWILFRTLPSLVALVSWPVSAALIVKGIKASGYRERMGSLALRPVILLVGSAMLGFALLLLVLRMAGGALWAVDLGCVFLLLGLLCAFVSDLISTTNLPGTLRRNTMQPYLQFVLLAAAQYLSLLIAALLLRQLRAGERLTLDVVIEQIRHLAAFSHVFETIAEAQRSPVGILLTLTGLAFFAMIGKLLFQYRQFIRQPADHAYIVANLAIRGRFEAARRWLDALSRLVLGDSALLHPRILVLLGENRYDEAYRLVGTFHGLRRDEHSLMYRTQTVDDLLNSLLGTAKTINLDPDQYRRLVAFVVEQGISDACLSIHLASLIEPMSVDRVEELEPLGITADALPVSFHFSGWLLADDPVVEYDVRLRLGALVPASGTDRIARTVAQVRIRLWHHEDVVPPFEELLDLVAGADDLPSWARVEFGLALNEFAGRSRLIGPELRARARQCEMTLLDGAPEDELAAIRSILTAGRMLTA